MGEQKFLEKGKEVSENNSRLLEKLEEVTHKFETAQINYWVIGGWTVDGYVGEVTREHNDVDIFIWKEDEDKARRVFEELGYEILNEEEHPSGKKIVFNHKFVAVKDGIVIDCLFLETDGEMAFSPKMREINFPNKFLKQQNVSINANGRNIGFKVPCLELMLVLKGRSPRAKDTEDVARISEIVGAERTKEIIAQYALDYDEILKKILDIQL